MSHVTEYERYLHTPELLGLQKPASERAHHDELLFQVVHQVEELWMKLAIEELPRIQGDFDSNATIAAATKLARVRQIFALMTAQIGLVETMTPHSYFKVRAVLGNGSGQESPGFNGLLRELPKLWAPFEAMLIRGGVTLFQAHQEPDRHPEIVALSEAMFDVDEGFQSFRYHHLALVKRIIGGATPSLKGKPNELLERSMSTQMFPGLWAVREQIFRHFVPGSALP